MADSSENQQAEQPSQFSPTLFDFEAFLAQEAAGGFLQPPTQDDVGLDYQDFSDLDLAPRISYPVEEEPPNPAEPSDWQDAFQVDPNLERPPLDAPRLAIHGGSPIPITVISPGLSQWHPIIPEGLPPNHWSYPAPITRPSSAAAVSRPASDTPEGGPFLNPILNSFTHPSTPLRVIDAYKYPFEDELQRALEAELQRQNEIAAKQDLADFYQAELRRRRESNEALEAKYALLAQDLPIPSTPAPTPAGDGNKTPRNKRPMNISNTDPKKWYRPLSIRPDSWGAINPQTMDRTFNYTEHGELNPRDVFSVQQMSEYIGSHRATLWIQTVPADSGRRYPSKTSDKCRFASCPDSNRTIRKGDFRVAFDEHPTNTLKDPFHNAAYTHLFCLEKFLDFPQICKSFDVRPDTRTLKEGKNRMAITRDHKSMEDIVRTFIRESVEWKYFNGGRRPENYYEYTLCSKLTKEHLAKQPKHLQTIREQRGGNTIDIHQNNLDIFVANQELKKERAERRPSDAKRERRGRKRKNKGMSNEEDSDESGLDEDILQRGLNSAQSRGMKKPRMSETEALRRWNGLDSKRKFSNHESEDEDSEEEEFRRLYKRLRSGRSIPSL
ncbi:hypothetical protein DL95DRAFT_502062 [Leptodontidium sp. 2 PMI_412]|nr:hypothetical protein DL95DRAFT_502062 [Leptodontidium sp. 2 PMI_412]